ncbi:phosphoribosyl-AMP cyclohydrolase [Simiduia litorea]|uniref:phosphoribosyl-AMP cyclohydrolase n=1 Tax=Simiduia litorea TaxID=1435348 RepID=UPI0036F28746
MLNRFYQTLEAQNDGATQSLGECIARLNFNAEGLIPVITQCHMSGQVLMQAWMNQAAIEKTLVSGHMTYWSRSRRDFWIKGETSGHVQQLVSMRFDCDGDAILCLVEQTGAACHTGRRTCFYLWVDSNNQQVVLQQGENGY